MMKFYVTTRELWSSPHPFGDGLMLPKYNLFHSGRGSHYVDLGGGMILLAGDFYLPVNEHIWHRQLGVARMQHPVNEAYTQLGDMLTEQFAHKKYRQYHHEAITKGLGLADHHTVWDVHEAAKKIHPLCKLDEVY